MKPVQELDWINGDLAIWHDFDPEVRCECSSTAVRTQAGWILFDPLPLSETALAELLAAGNVHAIALTNANHQRESLALRSLLNAPIHACASAQGEIEANSWLHHGESLAGFSLIELPGAASGEASWCNGKELILGDALVHLDRLEFLPDKYCMSPAGLRTSCRKFLESSFERIFFAHGLPILSRAPEQLASLIA